jgi:hypothetical protein
LLVLLLVSHCSSNLAETLASVLNCPACAFQKADPYPKSALLKILARFFRIVGLGTGTRVALDQCQAQILSA